jgi:hypothetical protein
MQELLHVKKVAVSYWNDTVQLSSSIVISLRQPLDWLAEI